MDLKSLGRRDLAEQLAREYFRATGDEEGIALLPFYVAYRAAVRAKVEGFTSGEPEVPAVERVAAVESARAHWLLALEELDQTRERCGVSPPVPGGLRRTALGTKFFRGVL